VEEPHGLDGLVLEQQMTAPADELDGSACALLPISSEVVPLYEFRCRHCGVRFEALTAPTEAPPCPNCKAAAANRLFSPISRPLKLGLRGAAARRSNALRRAREERRREERAKRRDESSG
jgi:putative FmdB family regulatory protein